MWKPSGKCSIIESIFFLLTVVESIFKFFYTKGRDFYMLISDIMNKEYRLCDFNEREKSVIYWDVDLDALLLEGAEKEDEITE